MAEIAVRIADEPIFTSDNPRKRGPAGHIKRYGKRGRRHLLSQYRKPRAGYLFAIANAKKGDVVLIAGKGHETYQQIGNETFDFDDAEVAGRAYC